MEVAWSQETRLERAREGANERGSERAEIDAPHGV